MKLHEIIKHNENETTSILYEALHPYKKLLYAYYSNEFYPSEPVLMVTSVFNAAQYAKIVPSEDFMQIVEDFAKSRSEDIEDIETDIETINFNSTFLKNIL